MERWSVLGILRGETLKSRSCQSSGISASSSKKSTVTSSKPPCRTTSFGLASGDGCDDGCDDALLCRRPFGRIASFSSHVVSLDESLGVACPVSGGSIRRRPMISWAEGIESASSGCSRVQVSLRAVARIRCCSSRRLTYLIATSDYMLEARHGHLLCMCLLGCRTLAFTVLADHVVFHAAAARYYAITLATCQGGYGGRQDARYLQLLQATSVACLSDPLAAQLSHNQVEARIVANKAAAKTWQRASSTASRTRILRDHLAPKYRVKGSMPIGLGPSRSQDTRSGLLLDWWRDFNIKRTPVPDHGLTVRRRLNAHPYGHIPPRRLEREPCFQSRAHEAPHGTRLGLARALASSWILLKHARRRRAGSEAAYPPLRLRLTTGPAWTSDYDDDQASWIAVARHELDVTAQQIITNTAQPSPATRTSAAAAAHHPITGVAVRGLGAPATPLGSRAPEDLHGSCRMNAFVSDMLLEACRRDRHCLASPIRMRYFANSRPYWAVFEAGHDLTMSQAHGFPAVIIRCTASSSHIIEGPKKNIESWYGLPDVVDRAYRSHARLLQRCARPTCGRCSRAGLPCSYGPTNPGPMPIRFIDETPGRSQDSEGHSRRRNTAARGASTAISSRIERLDQMLHSLGQEAESSSEPDGSPISTEDLGHLHLGPESQSKYVSSAFWASISQEVSEINDLLQNQQERAAKHPSSNVSSSSLASTSLSESLTASTTRRRKELAQRQLYGDIFQHIPAWSGSEQDLPLPHLQQSSIDELLAVMPSPQQCNFLVWAYIRGYHPVAPMVHAPTFLSQYMSFRAWREQGATDTTFSVHFFALLSAVLFAGSVVCPAAKLREVFGTIARETISSRMYEFAVAAIRLSDFPQSPSVESLAAFIIVDTVWLREEQPLTCCSFVGLAVRVAQMLGLHKDPSNFPGISIIEAEVRRRVWWQLLTCDTAVALASGLVPLIDPSAWDVQPISELTESRLMDLAGQSEPSTLNYPRHSILGVLAGGRLQYIRHANALIRILNMSRLTREDVDRSLVIVSKVQADLADRVRRVAEIENNMPDEEPELTPFRSLVQTSETSPRLARWARAILSLLSLKTQGILYGPVRRAGLLRYYLQRVPEAAQNSKRLLHGFLALCQTPDFQPFHWSWPGQHQPLHALMTVLQDLEDFPDASGVLETRKLIDLAVLMSSSGPDGKFGNNVPSTASAESIMNAWSENMASWGIIADEGDDDQVTRPLNQGGAEAWMFVRRMRHRVWQKAGLDPTHLSCPSRADEIDLELAITGVPTPRRAGTVSSTDSDEDRGTSIPPHHRRQSIQPIIFSDAILGTHREAYFGGGRFEGANYFDQAYQDPGASLNTAAVGPDQGVGDTLFQGEYPETTEDWAHFANSMDTMFIEDETRPPPR
ncbi:hypothetical protein FH972_025793 [Carpinus fangiana]|uniref:Xylanolytic transcriptional activator regulatory domain-containing protein n=1 Tax=Carpinus fangiana TaxID=176857 RepID=A0A5N6L221_9ROSI|nr:hypothetical protein FH972_025793 [Carpinus fangiana]